MARPVPLDRRRSLLAAASPWLAILAFVAVSVGWLATDRRIAKEAYGAYSVHNTSATGLSLARAYLRGRAGTEHGVASALALNKPIARAGLEPDAVVFRIRPDAPAFFEIIESTRRDRERRHAKRERERARARDATDSRDEAEPVDEGGDEDDDRDGADEPDEVPARAQWHGCIAPAELAWVRGGGTLVLAVDATLADLEVHPAPGNPPARKVYPTWEGITHVLPPTARGLRGGPAELMHTVFAAADAMVVGRWRLGAGRIVALSCPEVFQNARIGKGDHLLLLERLAGVGRPVYFDEYVHGMRAGGGAMEVLKSWGLGPLMVMTAAAALVAFWRARVRIGPPEEPRPEARTEAVEFVDSLAELYARALSRREAICLFRDAFVHEVSVRTGLRGEELKNKVSQLLHGTRVPATPEGPEIGRGAFRMHLRELTQAFRRLNDARRF
jgi:hypothetical protein